MRPPENPFESGRQKVIPAVLVYLRHRDQVLMIHRVSKKPVALEKGDYGKVDYHEGKWNGLGGKCELGESPVEASRREIHEEAGIDLPEALFRPLGVLQFPNFKAHRNEDWIVFVFTGELTDEQVERVKLKESEEGDLHWVPRGEILSLGLWPGDRHFLPFVLDSKPFLGTIWYQGQDVLKHSISLLVP